MTIDIKQGWLIKVSSWVESWDLCSYARWWSKYLQTEVATFFLENGHHCILALFRPKSCATTWDQWFNSGSYLTESSLFSVHGHPCLCCSRTPMSCTMYYWNDIYYRCCYKFRRRCHWYLTLKDTIKKSSMRALKWH